MVTVLLLYGGRPQRVRAEASGRDEAGYPGHSQGVRALRPGAGAGRPVARRQGIHGAGAIRVRSSDPAGSPVSKMARVRSGRHYSLLRLAPARGRDDQVESAEDHRPGHRLALPQRAQEGVEDVKRREFLRGAAIAGAAGVLPPIRSDAAGPPSETTTLKIAFRPGLICQAPLYVAEELLPAGGFTEVQYVPQAGDVGIRR